MNYKAAVEIKMQVTAAMRLWDMSATLHTYIGGCLNVRIPLCASDKLEKKKYSSNAFWFYREPE